MKKTKFILWRWDKSWSTKTRQFLQNLRDSSQMNAPSYDFDTSLEEIISQIKGYYHPRLLQSDEKLVRKAYDFAKKSHEGQKRFSGEEYFIHPVEATKILLSINPDVETVAACLLHDVIEDTPVTAEEVGILFGDRVRFLCEGVEKVAKVKLAASDLQQKKFENFQKLFIAMAQDIRVIFVKLADRIHNLRTLEYVREDKRERIAYESLEIYAPVAEQMGLFGFKNEIEDWSFRVLEPEKHARLSTEFNEIRKTRIKYIEQARREILKAARQEEFLEEIISISGREKNLYSLYKKMKRKHVDRVEDIFDLLGVRMVVKTKEDCYRALGIVHGHWRPILGRFKDYISVPKSNGYQSLHTTVLGLGQSRVPMEIQIRTEKMNTDAELGPAAHWAYKKKGSSDFDAEYLSKTAWLPRKLEKNKPLSAEQFFEEVSQSIFSQRVHVFTPKGDVKFLPRGATSVDYAYSVHTEIGDACVGSLVNGVIRPLDKVLQNGDVVEILTKPGRKPNPHWLSFVRSNSVRHKIMAALRRDGDFEIIAPEKQKKQEKKKIILEHSEIEKKESTSSQAELIIGGETNLSYRFATCCDPTQKTPLRAYKSRGLQFVVHDARCDELARLDVERMFDARFLIVRKMKVFARQKVGILHRCAEIFDTKDINILDITLQKVRGEGVVIHFELGAVRLEDMEKARLEILKVYGINEVDLVA
jgi:GTP pyrophosphokinase